KRIRIPPSNENARARRHKSMGRGKPQTGRAANHYNRSPFQLTHESPSKASGRQNTMKNHQALAGHLGGEPDCRCSFPEPLFLKDSKRGISTSIQNRKRELKGFRSPKKMFGKVLS